MHDRVSDILGREIVGIVVREEGELRDVGLGRLCLARLAKDEIGEIADLLRDAFGGRLEVRDRLHLEAPQERVRGWIEFLLHSDDASSPYVLQVTSLPVVSLYERRFMLAHGVSVDLWSALCEGLFALLAGGMERPFRVLSGYEELYESYLARLDQAVRGTPSARGKTATAAGAPAGEAAAAGAAAAAAAVAELSPGVRRVWRLLPWPVREQIRPPSAPASLPRFQHEGRLRSTILSAVDTREGAVVYEYVHSHRPLEDYPATLGWMSDVADALVDAYPPPRYAVAMARAPSVQAFLDHFPGYQGVVGDRLGPD